MEVQEHDQSISVLVLKFKSKVLQKANFREKDIHRGLERSIEVSPTQTGAVIAQNDPIWVEHRYYFYYEF